MSIFGNVFDDFGTRLWDNVEGFFDYAQETLKPSGLELLQEAKKTPVDDEPDLSFFSNAEIRDMHKSPKASQYDIQRATTRQMPYAGGDFRASRSQATESVSPKALEAEWLSRLKAYAKMGEVKR